MSEVLIVMGSKSDLSAVKPAYDMLKHFKISTEMRVLSAHRTPALVSELATTAKDNGVKVIIAAAGKAAHLAGVIAANTILPVIGIPVKSSTLDGLDSLLSTVQMPSGVPVATVAIDGAKNAAILAIQIIAIGDDMLTQKLLDLKKSMQESILEDDTALQKEI